MGTDTSALKINRVYCIRLLWYIKLILFLVSLSPGLYKGKKMFSCQFLWHILYFTSQRDAVERKGEAAARTAVQHTAALGNKDRLGKHVCVAAARCLLPRDGALEPVSVGNTSSVTSPGLHN